MMDTMAQELVPELVDVDVATSRPRLVALLFCNWLNETADGKTNLIGTFDQMNLPSGATTSAKFWLFVRTVGTLDDDVRVGVYAPTGHRVAELAFKFEPNALASAGTAVNCDAMVHGQFPAPQAGRYLFVVFYRSEVLGSATMAVTMTDDAPEDPP